VGCASHDIRTQQGPGEDVRADLTHTLPSGLLVLPLRNAVGLGTGGEGYQRLRFTVERCAPAAGFRVQFLGKRMWSELGPRSWKLEPW
jgi:hypothetical protein